MAATMDEVLEKHRNETGALALHVTLGPEATPEGIDAVLTKLRGEMDAYGAFRPEEREEAKVVRLRALLRQIHDLARAGRTDEIAELTDMVADVELDRDTAWMIAQREKRGEPLPA